jgi:hypothetical protein
VSAPSSAAGAPPDVAADDERLNNLVAAGGVFMCFLQTGVYATPVCVDGQATNQVVIRFPFLNSPYLVTVERIDERDEPRAEGAS